MSTHFKRKDIHKGTWTPPNGEHINQIDHALVNKQHQRIVKNVRSCRGADINFDHFLVKIDIKIRKQTATKTKKMPKKQFRMEMLEHLEIRKRYQRAIGQECRETSHEEATNVKAKWKKIESAIQTATEKVIPLKHQQKKAGWWNEGCRKETELRNKLRIKTLQTDNGESKQAYKTQRAKVKNMNRQKKKAYNEKKIDDVEIYFKRKEMRNFYGEAKKENIVKTT